jgi:hypothetical protein
VTPENVKRYETYQDLFSHPGWKQLEEEFEENISTLKDNLVSSPNEAWSNVLRGRITTFKDLLGFPSLVEKALEDNVEADPV